VASAQKKAFFIVTAMKNSTLMRRQKFQDIKKVL
jgi:hypothetical protein